MPFRKKRKKKRIVNGSNRNPEPSRWALQSWAKYLPVFLPFVRFNMPSAYDRENTHFSTIQKRVVVRTKMGDCLKSRSLGAIIGVSQSTSIWRDVLFATLLFRKKYKINLIYWLIFLRSLKNKIFYQTRNIKFNTYILLFICVHSFQIYQQQHISWTFIISFEIIILRLVEGIWKDSILILISIISFWNSCNNYEKK